MISLLATDLDGTLFYPRRKITMIPHRNIAFLRRLYDRGIRLALVTSRNRDYAERVIAKVKRPMDIIGGNGTFVIANGKTIFDQSLENKWASEIFDFVRKTSFIRAWLLQSRDKGIILYADHISRWKTWLYTLYYAWQGVYKEGYTFDNEMFLKELSGGQLYKIMLYFGFHKDAPETAKKMNVILRERYPSVESSWIRQFIEITPQNCNKAEGLRRYCEAVGIAPEAVHVVGDSGNDIAMFKAFKHSYCMAHASPAVKKYAAHSVRRLPDIARYLPKEKEQ